MISDKRDEALGEAIMQAIRGFPEATMLDCLSWLGAITANVARRAGMSKAQLVDCIEAAWEQLERDEKEQSN